MIFQSLTHEPSWVTTVRPYLELVYYLSGDALAIIAGIALRQISIAKTDIQIRSRREAASLAANLHDRFLEKVQPLWFELQSKMLVNNISNPSDLPDSVIFN